MCKKPVNKRMRLAQQSFVDGGGSQQATPKAPHPGSLRGKQRPKKLQTEKAQEQNTEAKG